MFVIWWWPVIDAVVVCGGKFTPVGNGTETTKLPTDDDGCRDGSKWKSTKYIHTIQNDRFKVEQLLIRLICSNDIPSFCFTMFDVVLFAAFDIELSVSAHFCYNETEWICKLRWKLIKVTRSSLHWALFAWLTFFVSAIMLSVFSYANGTNVTETSFILSLCVQHVLLYCKCSQLTYVCIVSVVLWQ